MLLNKNLFLYSKVPKFVHNGRFIYLLRKLFIICKDHLVIAKNDNKELIYILTKSSLVRNLKTPEYDKYKRINLINDFQSLIEISISKCYLVENIDYKINILDVNYIPIENDSQLLSYNGQIIYCKITEVEERNLEINEIKSTQFMNFNSMINSLFNFQSQTSSKSFIKEKQSEPSVNSKEVSVNIRKLDTITSEKTDNGLKKGLLPQILEKRKQNSFGIDFISTSTFNPSKTGSIKDTPLNYSHKPSNKSIEEIKKSEMTLNHQKNEEVKPLNIHKIFPSSFSSTSLSIIPSKKFPIRGRMVQKRFKRASSTNDLSETLSETSKNKKANLSHVFNPYFRMKESMISKEEKMKIMKSFLLSKSQFEEIANRTQNLIRQHDNDIIKQEYTGFLLELRQAVLQNLDKIITDNSVSLIPKMESKLNLNSSYEQTFPFKQCTKEFILYCYLSDTLDTKKGDLLKLIQEQYPIKTTEISKCISELKEKLIQVINNKSNDIINNFLINKKKEGELQLNSSFFEVFVLCADYFNGNQRDFADNILLVLEVDEQRRTISYDLFSKYYLYFRCYDLVTNEQKFNFVKKLLNLVYGKEIFMKKQLSNLQIEIRTILNIDELTMKFFTKELIFSNSVEINKGYNKIDLIYLNMINYFTYQH